MTGPKLVQFPREPNAAEVLVQLVNEEGRKLQNVVVLYTTNDGRSEITGTPNSIADMLLFIDQRKHELIARTLTGPVKLSS